MVDWAARGEYSEEERQYVGQNYVNGPALLAEHDAFFGTSEEDGSEVEEVEEDNYPDWTNKELREHLELFGLGSQGNKGELVARLRENDIGPEDEPAE